MTARSLAIAAENREIDASTARAVAAASKPRNALEAMAQRLQIQPANLKATLMNTAFSTCQNESQFMALVVVANEYGLNPLLKEIYAFPAKGQGIVPMVSIDGWIRIMNEHPAFDGIEFEYTPDAKGGIEAIEAIIYRKDRTHPIKVIEYLEECKRNTDPWNKSPRRMLRHRALMQGARVAFGFSGIAVEGEDDIDGGYIQSEAVPSLPTRQALAEELNDSIPAFDAETGEVARDPATGMSEVDEETARALDANDGTLSDENPTAAEGPADEQRGEATEELTAAQIKFGELMDALRGANGNGAINKVESEYLKHCVAFPKEAADQFEALLQSKRQGGEAGQ
ncbi:recombinase RecT [Novosphingobium sp.]|uniref:recombinase RecT n=1 Tax=Novosphingobium sp. TaxID=1874826 RepID=UPI00286E9439|nr:recombinase RecT [Novosphingobium sp.]